MAGERQADAEARIRAATEQLLAGETPAGLKTDVKSLCVLAGVPRATLYRTYPHLKAEFERRLAGAREEGRQPDPRLAQVDRLKNEVAELRARLGRLNAVLTDLQAFRATALSRLAAQHDEIIALRRELAAAPGATVHRLPTR